MSANVKYSDEFKRAAVARILAGEVPLSVSRDLGLPGTSLIYKWRKQYGDTDRPSISAKSTKGPSGRTVYSLAVKERAIHMVKHEGRSLKETAKELRIPSGRVESWVRNGVKRGMRGEAGAVIIQEQVAVIAPTRQHRSPSPFSNKDTRQYLLLMEASVLAGIRDGRIKTLRDNPELVLALNALVSCERGEDQ
jgi:transposase-like protein